MDKLILLPQPRTLELRDGQHILRSGKLIAIVDTDLFPAGRRLQASLAKLGIQWEIVAASAALPRAQIGLLMQRIENTDFHPSYYTLDIAPDLITIAGGFPDAHFYGVCTLIQIIEQRGPALPALHITDWPDFSRRGVMLDISRDKVPTMDTLYALIDRLAGWKINEVQLYTEHTFAYRAHPVVWANASPMTAEQIMALDSFCRERFIDLVPNQNSFGHMHRWLMHPEYAHLAEVPEGLDWPFMLTPRPFSIAPALPESLKFIEGLYDELLPNFSSVYFNVGCDETADLGRGRSKALVEERGAGRVYLDFIRQIEVLTRKHGRIMQFWGDIVMEYPELVGELPPGVIALEWGYQADHPFDRDGARFAQVGIPFYVCPGTSSWLSMVGRTDNAIGNLKNAAENGIRHDAIGYLITDWGDYGHWQPLPVSYLGFACGAAFSWCYSTNAPDFEACLPEILNRFAFEDATGVMGHIAYDSGLVYRIVDDYPHLNAVNMVRALFAPLDRIRSKVWIPRDPEPKTFTPAKLRAAIDAMDALVARLDDARPADRLVTAEYRMAAGLFKHSCKRLLLTTDPGQITLAGMAAELRALQSQFVDCWMARNRPGGLGDSLARMARMYVEYEPS